jgi:hypothetical protein
LQKINYNALSGKYKIRLRYLGPLYGTGHWRRRRRRRRRMRRRRRRRI